MITINSLRIDNSATHILGTVTVSSLDKLTKLLVWNKDTFKDYDKAIDLSYLLEKTNYIENIVIEAKSDLKVDKIVGTWFFEFESSKTTLYKDEKTIMGVVGNFIQYHECVLHKMLDIEVNNCKPVINYDCNDNKNCDECDDYKNQCEEINEQDNKYLNNVFYLNDLIRSLKDALRLNYYKEAIKIINVLDCSCLNCDSCPDYDKNIKFVKELGVGTESNRII